MKVLRGCLILIAILVVALLLSLGILQWLLNRQAEAQAWEQITLHYGTTQIVQNNRVYYGQSPSFSYSYAQICYDVSITSQSGAAVRKVVMVTGDDDGGVFFFGREYSSMDACRAAFNHG